LVKELYTIKLRVIYNVVTMAPAPKASLNWPRDYNDDVKRWARRPDGFDTSPKSAILRKLYDFLVDNKGTQIRLPRVQQLATYDVSVSMNVQRSELEYPTG
jgi:hypothetical protein